MACKFAGLVHSPYSLELSFAHYAFAVLFSRPLFFPFLSTRSTNLHDTQCGCSKPASECSAFHRMLRMGPNRCVAITASLSAASFFYFFAAPQYGDPAGDTCSHSRHFHRSEKLHQRLCLCGDAASSCKLLKTLLPPQLGRVVSNFCHSGEERGIAPKERRVAPKENRGRKESGRTKNSRDKVKEQTSNHAKTSHVVLSLLDLE